MGDDGGKRELIRLFDGDVPKVGNRIDHEGESWVVTDIATVSGRWAAWGRRYDPDVTTVLIVDDEFDMRLLVRTIIEIAHDHLKVVGEASDGAEAVMTWRGLEGSAVPDVIILDNRMPHLTGLEAARLILDERPAQIVVLYSAFLDDEVRAEARALGVAACVSKSHLEELPGLIRTLTAA